MSGGVVPGGNAECTLLFISFYFLLGLMLMYNVLQGSSENSTLSDRFYCVLFKVLLDANLEHCSKIAMFLNLVYRSIKADASPKRVLAFLKRLLQVAASSSPQMSASIMMIISEIVKHRPEVADAFYGRDESNKPHAEGLKFKSKKIKQKEKKRAAKEQETCAQGGDKDFKDEGTHSSEYNVNARNPLFANADRVPPWELIHLNKHFHPSVALFADNVCAKKHIVYDGDPLADFTLKHFLNRFVFRNPKAVTHEESSFARQASVFGRLKSASKSPTLDPTNVSSVSEKKIPLEERFIFKYLSSRESRKDVGDDIDNESVASDEFEQLLDKYETDVDKFDVAADYRKSKKRKQQNDDAEDEDENSDDDDASLLDDEDDELDFDDDEEYRAAFGGLNSDDDSDGGAFSDDDDIPSEHIRRGRSKTTSSLFASADEFAALLEGRGGKEDVGDSSGSSDLSEDDGDGFFDPDEPSASVKPNKRKQLKQGKAAKRFKNSSKGGFTRRPPKAKRFANNARN